jgi:hypothetical protein
MAALLSSTAGLHAQITSSFFGMHVNQNDIVTGGDGVSQIQFDYWPTTENVNFSIFRTHDAGGYPIAPGSQGQICGPPTCSSVAMKWSDLDTQNGYQFQNLDNWAGQLQSGQVMLFTAYWTPNYVSGDPGDTCGWPNGNWNRPSGGCALPLDDKAWTGFISNLVSHIQNHKPLPLPVKYIEVWNEPDVTNECDPNPPNGNSQAACTASRLAKMTQIAKSYAAPAGIQVISPPVTNDGVYPKSMGGNGYLQQLLNPPNNVWQYADVIGLHGYVSQHIDTKLTDEILEAQSEVSTACSCSMPLYNSEGSWLQTDDVGNPSNEDEQAAWLGTAYLVQAYYATTSNPLAGYAFYGWDYETNSKDRESALWDWWGPGAPRLTAAGAAYQQVYEWLLNATPQAACTSSGNLNSGDLEWTCQFYNSAYGGQTLAVWDSCSDNNYYDCGDYVNTPSGYLWYYDLTGQKHALPTPTFQITAWPVLLTTK